jgi:hypothetical protein
MQDSQFLVGVGRYIYAGIRFHARPAYARTSLRTPLAPKAAGGHEERILEKVAELISP